MLKGVETGDSKYRAKFNKSILSLSCDVNAWQ